MSAPRLLDGDRKLSEMAGTLHVGERFARLAERERAVDDQVHPVALEKVVQRLEARAADVDAAAGRCARDEEAGVRRLASEHADERSPVRGDGVHRLAERARPADFDDVLDAALFRESRHTSLSQSGSRGG